MAKLNLALRPDEIGRIAEGLGREPTTVELYAFDAQWSEHCSYKSSRHLLKKLPATGPNVVVGPGEDAGVVYLGEHDGERYCVVVAHESHNHPSQVVPFEGAATGVGGIVRDVLCMGAEVIGLADCLRFGNVDDPQSHQRYVAQQVVDGIAAYGNAIGVPNVAGDVYFHEGFNDNCLVNVIALGLVKEKDIIHSRAPKGSAGWDIVLVGKATDASGFGGASFSSLTLEEANQEANKSAVQVPDPFLKNVIMRATYRVFAYLREKNITAGFKDLGAGGIMGCTAELCAAGGYGAIIDLDDVNVAVENLPPEVIAVGETQERLCWLLPGDATADVLRIYNEEFSLPEIARGARATVIGAVQEEKRYVMRHGDETVMDVPVEFLTGAIQVEPPVAAPPAAASAHRSNGNSKDFSHRLLEQLSGLECASREPLFKEYDAVVRGRTVLPRGSADAGVLAPIPGSPLGLAVAVAGRPGDSARVVFEAIAKIVAVGARPLALTDCLNFGNPNDPRQFSMLSEAVSDLSRAAHEFSLPFVSGNVSLYNEDRAGRSVPPSAVVACIGALDDISQVVTPSLKGSGAALYLLQPDPGNLDSQARLLRFVGAAGSLLTACKTLDSGGVLAALSQMIFVSGCAWGAELDLSQTGLLERVTAADLCFGERLGWIVQVGAAREFLDLANAHKLTSFEVVYLGATSQDPELSIGQGETIIAGTEELRAAWERPLSEVYV